MDRHGSQKKKILVGTVLAAAVVLLALTETVKSLMKQSVWPLESVSTTM